MYKWLTVIGIVCLGFVIILLSLGYLLKENEVATTALKQKLDQQKQLNSSDKNTSKAVLTLVDKQQEQENKLNHFKSVIIKNLTCATSQQCVLVNTKEPDLNCIVAVNTIGASLVKKALKKEKGKGIDNGNACASFKQNLNSVCKKNICQIEADF
ncbi:hypothetical protein [Colwellia sp. UCD-KL20]|uniref:hypothetical protein n=1 Tax=Colwellia sp. UCD-KL20 TaxID=1917165 RepID=UPI0009704978|nr:hypothetical protein [Colwellia sp. UCD-KL20]